MIKQPEQAAARTFTANMHFSQLKQVRPFRSRRSGALDLFNKALRKLKIPLQMQPAMDPHADMVSPEQYINLYHLLLRVLDLKVQGDFVELGCHTGSSTAVIASVMEERRSTSRLHAFDLFTYGGKAFDQRKQFEQNLTRLQLPLPVIHEGDIFLTVPEHLPEKIAFVHIDLGTGVEVQLHARLVGHCLAHVYSRMEPGAIGILMDYHDPEHTIEGFNSNPGMTVAAKEFFKDKPEQVHTLYGGEYSHGYFQKL